MNRLLRPLLALVLAASAFAAAAAPKPTAAPVEGRDYEVIADGRPYRPAPGVVEVVEVFGYTCPHCAHFEPALEAWSRKLPKKARLVRLPAAFGGYWTPYARAYFAAQALGVAERSHRDMFDALHFDDLLPISGVTVDELAGFYKDYGVDPARFAAAYQAKSVDAQIAASTDWIMRAGIEGTPTLVVAGKYRVTGDTQDGVLKTARWLVDRELARAR
ncbi:thiol:disulfide interchange protein DsbA/DsbL [Lysobacter humi (ex Lee et al. 2017)]